MNKSIFYIMIICLFVYIGYYSYNLYLKNETLKQSQNNSNYEAERIITEVNIPTPLNTFSTPILSKNENRLKNLQLATSTINEYVLKSKEEFSFCNIVGNPTEDLGYLLADSFNEKGETIQLVGGGVCQVSTTIYNVALETENIEITERNPHSKKVNYIEDGKDAAVAYDYKDLKFINNNDFDIQIISHIENDEVIVKFLKL